VIARRLRKISLGVVSISLLAFSLFFRPWPALAASSGDLNGLVIALQSDKRAFILGEPISLTFSVTNKSNGPIELPNFVDVLGGSVRVQIALEDGPYREYRGPGWGLTNRVHSQTLSPGGSIETGATVLHHRAPKRGDLNEQRWNRITESEIVTEIALSKPGRYRLKAILFNKIESLPLEIHVSEPQSMDDIELWKAMNAEPEYALFMQTGWVLRGKITDPETKAFVAAFENFVNFHATSTYAPHFRAAIAKHRADLAKVNAAKN
jgi:hypothetical protein